MYRDDYAALQARADAAQRHLEELRASSSQNEEKIRALSRELTAATKALATANRRLGHAPRRPAMILIPILLLGLLFVAGASYVRMQGSKLDAKEALLQARMNMAQELIQAKQPPGACTPEGQGFGGASLSSLVPIERPEGCSPRMLPGAGMLTVIHNEAEFQEHYNCASEEMRPSGLDFKRFRLVVAYQAARRLKATFAVQEQGRVFVGIQPLLSDCGRKPSEEDALQAVEFLLPAGDEPVSTSMCPLVFDDACP